MSDEVDMDVVLREIEDEVAQRRASGDIPPELERELDVIFARFAPPAFSGDDLDAVLVAAEQASIVDVDVPTGSNMPGVAYLKRGLRKLMEWYLRYLAQQVSEMATSWAAALKVLAGRVKALESAVVEHPLEDLTRGRAEPEAAVPFGNRLVEFLAACPGRILVAESGDATVLRRLVDEGLDAYGVDPDGARVDAAVRAGLEVRTGEVLAHLGGVAEARLSALVLCGCVDWMTLARQVELSDLAAAVLADGGRVAVVGTSPAAWARSVDVVTADLAPGRPLHFETWVTLLERRGFADLITYEGPPVGTLRAMPPGEGSDVLNANLARIEEALFGPASFLLTGIRTR